MVGVTVASVTGNQRSLLGMVAPVYGSPEKSCTIASLWWWSPFVFLTISVSVTKTFPPVSDRCQKWTILSLLRVVLGERNERKQLQKKREERVREQWVSCLGVDLCVLHGIDSLNRSLAVEGWGRSWSGGKNPPAISGPRSDWWSWGKISGFDHLFCRQSAWIVSSSTFEFSLLLLRDDNLPWALPFHISKSWTFFKATALLEM